jgi:hypothetical protein
MTDSLADLRARIEATPRESLTHGLVLAWCELAAAIGAQLAARAARTDADPKPTEGA